MDTDEKAVLAANEAFYQAFSLRDLPGMDTLWARYAPVACVHPGWPALHDRAAVLRSWRLIFLGKPPTVHVEDPTVALLGDSAFVVCREEVFSSDGEHLGALLATNVFVREEGSWRLVHHHSGPAPDSSDDSDEVEEEPGSSGGLLN